MSFFLCCGRVCSVAGALGTVLHMRDAVQAPQPDFDHLAAGAPAFPSEQPRARPQPQMQMPPRYSWEVGHQQQPQQQQQLKRPRLSHDDGRPGSPQTGAASAQIGGYDGAQSWARASAPVSIGEPFSSH